MSDAEQLIRATTEIADAIGRRDVETVAGWLAPDFRHRSPGAEVQDAGAFVDAIRRIPGEVLFVHVGSVTVDVSGQGALVTGIQHARVRIDGADIDDHRVFIDWFVKHDGRWRIRTAVDLQAPPELLDAASAPPAV
jgi:ketosteroid isomerase-like protein